MVSAAAADAVWSYVALNKAKSLLDKAMEQTNRTQVYFERLVEIRKLLFELKNFTDHSTAQSEDATSLNQQNRRLLRSVLVYTDTAY